ncbi:MAG TPA: DUF4124 domain-containing protein [Casimicrobiaceae bacterium]|nr:DUF4124 domain-containing protein [Casimicrobiaceae bacterium]
MTEQAHSIPFGLSQRWLCAAVGCALLVFAAQHAHAALYKWTDERGVVHYSDQLPPDAVNRASYELNRQGQTVKKTEQTRPVVQHMPKNDTEEQKLREAQREQMLALRRDKALIESYANENEIDLAKSRAVGTIDGQVQSAEGLVAQMTKRRAELVSQEATYAPRPVPGGIKREIETIDAELGRQKDYIEAKKKESASIAARYDADKQRFRELTAPSPSGAVVTSDEPRLAGGQRPALKLTSTR